MSRGGLKITRTDYQHDYLSQASDRVNWIDSFADSYAKNAVEVSRERNQSLMDQINSIMNTKGQVSMESKLQDLRERTGLNTYLKQASQSSTDVPFQNLPQPLQDKLFSFIDNCISSNNGHVSIPSLQEQLYSTFRTDGVQISDLHSPEAAKYLNNKILETQKLYPSGEGLVPDLGKNLKLTDDDGSNSDFFKNLMPVRG